MNNKSKLNHWEKSHENMTDMEKTKKFGAFFEANAGLGKGYKMNKKTLHAYSGKDFSVKGKIENLELAQEIYVDRKHYKSLNVGNINLSPQCYPSGYAGLSFFGGAFND